MIPNQLYAQYHKFVFRPPKHYNLNNLDGLLKQCFSLTLNDFEDKSSTQEAKKRKGESGTLPFKEATTYNRLIDVEYVNSPKYGKTLNLITIQGQGLDTLKLDVGAILTEMEVQNFVCIECHSKILIPESTVTFPTLEKHFITKAYTADCRIVAPLTDPSNNHARTWAVGSRPAHKSINSVHGKRLIFYEASKVHDAIPAGMTEMEMQLFGDAANKFVYDTTLRDIDLTVKTLGIIRPYLTFKTLTGDKNVSRRSVARFWLSIIDNFPAIRIPRLNRLPPILKNKRDKFRTSLYGKKLDFGEILFLEVLTEFLQDQGLAAKAAHMLAFDQVSF